MQLSHLFPPSPNPSFLCLEIIWVCSHTFPYCLPRVYLPPRNIIGLVQMGILPYVSLIVISPHSELAYHILDQVDKQCSDHDYDLSVLVWRLFYGSVVPLTHTLEIITIFTGLFAWDLIVMVLFIYLFIFKRLILHNNSKDKFRLKIKKIICWVLILHPLWLWQCFFLSRT